MRRELKSEWKKRLRSPLIWHLAGASGLFVLVIFLIVEIGLSWGFAYSDGVRTLAVRKSQLVALTTEMAPMLGVADRLVTTKQRIHTFYATRIPENYSKLALRVGQLGTNSGVRLSGIRYSQGPPGIDLTEVSMEAGVSGEYPQIMRFVNALERDQVFFVIRAMSLNGQQGGVVDLRLRVSTWLRSADVVPSEHSSTPGPERAMIPADALGQGRR
jgi:type IV pilus assembly protein PilO